MIGSRSIAHEIADSVRKRGLVTLVGRVRAAVATLALTAIAGCGAADRLDALERAEARAVAEFDAAGAAGDTERWARAYVALYDVRCPEESDSGIWRQRHRIWCANLRTEAAGMREYVESLDDTTESE